MRRSLEMHVRRHGFHNFIAGHDDASAMWSYFESRIKNVNSPHHVCRKRRYGIALRLGDDGLSGQVKQDLEVVGIDGCEKAILLANIQGKSRSMGHGLASSKR